MILELPTEVQELVYDKLMIQDRISLNKALPSKKRFYKTSQTCKQKDIKLHVLMHVFKKNKVSAKDISGKLYRFLCENDHDPTIQHIFRENPELNPKNGSNNVNYLSVILRKVDNQEDVHKEIEEAPELTSENILSIMERAAKQCSPEYWDALIGLKKIKEQTNTMKVNFVLIFNMINFGNIELIKHVVSVQNDYPFLQKSLEEMRLPSFASIFRCTRDIETLLEHVQLSGVVVERMVKHHALNGDFDVALVYLKYMFHNDVAES